MRRGSSVRVKVGSLVLGPQVDIERQIPDRDSNVGFQEGARIVSQVGLNIESIVESRVIGV